MARACLLLLLTVLSVLSLHHPTTTLALERRSFSITANNDNGTVTSAAVTSARPCYYFWRGKRVAFARCAVLDKQRQFHLAWNLNRRNGIATVYFQGVPQIPYGWVGWGISPDGMMKNSDAIVAYGNPKSTAQARVRPYWMTGFKPSELKPDMTIGYLNVVPRQMYVEVVRSGSVMRIVAYVRGLSAPGQKRVMWRGGLGVSDFARGTLLPHTNLTKAYVAIDFSR